MEQTWNITELPLEMQKPQEIKKNKPKRKRGEAEETNGDEEEEDEFFDDPFMNAASRRQIGNSNYNNSYDTRRRY